MPAELLPFLQHQGYDAFCCLEVTSRLISEDEFSVSATYQRAFARSLEIVGEATKKLDKDFLDRYPSIPWSYMAKMRDKLIHHYFGIDYEMVWRTVVEDVPELKASVQKILEQLQPDARENSE